MTTIGDMTREELVALIQEIASEGIIDEKIRKSPALLELNLPRQDKLKWDEARKLVKKHRWTPPPGTPSVDELIREDRDS